MIKNTFIERDERNKTIKPDFIGNIKRLNLEFSNRHLKVLGKLYTPFLVQEFLNNEVEYNGEFLDGESNTAFSPLQVLRHRKANCFEGAVFASMVNFLHGHPSWIYVIERKQDYGHTICVHRFKKLFGVNEKGRGQTSRGKNPCYNTADGSARSLIRRELSLDRKFPDGYIDKGVIGIAGPIDLFHQFGTDWLTQKSDIWSIYYRLINSHTRYQHTLNGGHLPKIHPAHSKKDG
ncbi:MAG: hypothetical protein AAB929_02360 [Patescibacteria group bacterium]